MKNNSYKRRRYLIKRDLQFRFAFVIAASMTFVIVVEYFSFYILWNVILKEVEGVPASVTASMLRELFLSMSDMLALESIVLLAGFAVLAIFLSHRVAGPIYRFEESARAIASGDLSFKIHLRKTDELKDLAADINNMIDNLRSMVSEDKRMIKDANAISKEVSLLVRQKTPSKEKMRMVAKQLGHIIKKLNSTVSGYKT
jgi:methyl-accepting chemotaxis protein